MPHLRAVQPKAAVGLPPLDVRAAVRAWREGTATEAQQLRAYRYVVYELAGIEMLLSSMPGEESVVNWRQGCRFVGLSIIAASMMSLDEPDTVLPPARTATERVRRRNKARG